MEICHAGRLRCADFCPGRGHFRLAKFWLCIKSYLEKRESRYVVFWGCNKLNPSQIIKFFVAKRSECWMFEALKHCFFLQYSKSRPSSNSTENLHSSKKLLLTSLVQSSYCKIQPTEDELFCGVEVKLHHRRVTDISIFLNKFWQLLPTFPNFFRFDFDKVDYFVSEVKLWVVGALKVIYQVGMKIFLQ